MSLDDIGFYTLTDERARTASTRTPLARCEVLVTGRCNFACPYCRSRAACDAPASEVLDVLGAWARDGLRAVRFSGGEPTLHADLPVFVRYARGRGVARIAISTNGSASPALYDKLLAAGVNDWSVSLDACCAADGDRMAGVVGAWERVVGNIGRLARRTYTTVGVVVTDDNAASVSETVRLAASLGVHDVRVIPAAQCGRALRGVSITDAVVAKLPILRYRMRSAREGRSVRGLRPSDSGRCALVLDDMAVEGRLHYPCIIYLREGGAPIGVVGSEMRAERAAWSVTHDSHRDPICAENCLDVCVDYNNRVREFASDSSTVGRARALAPSRFCAPVERAASRC